MARSAAGGSGTKTSLPPLPHTRRAWPPARPAALATAAGSDPAHRQTTAARSDRLRPLLTRSAPAASLLPPAALFSAPSQPDPARSPRSGSPDKLRNWNSCWTPRTASPELPSDTSMTRAPHVCAPTTPSTVSCRAVWMIRTADSVRAPNYPTSLAATTGARYAPRRRGQPAGVADRCRLSEGHMEDTATSSPKPRGPAGTSPAGPHIKPRN
jgi:hypothetical protein